MKAENIITIGASAGGISALQQLVQAIPADLPAAILIVVHLLPSASSKLAALLDHKGPLPAVAASADEPIRMGQIYVAPPDRHMIVDDGHVRLWRGPRENWNRPAINPLFRSAAVTYTTRATGVILSGSLDDGSAGLWWIKQYGGTAIVQDPEEAAFPQMILSALEYVEVDHVVRLSEMGPLLARVAREAAPPAYGPGEVKRTEVSPWKPEKE